MIPLLASVATIIDTDLADVSPARDAVAPYEVKMSEESFSTELRLSTQNGNFIVNFPEENFHRSFLSKDYAGLYPEPTTVKIDEAIGLPVSPQKQGNTNRCGPTATAIVLQTFDKRATIEEVAKRANYSAITGTNPINLTKAIKSFGLEAALMSDISFDKLRESLKNNVYLIALVQAGDNTYHYLAIHGLEKYEDGSEYLLIADTNGSTYKTSLEDLTARWSNITFRGEPTGISNLGIFVSKDASLLPEGSLSPSAEHSVRMHKNLQTITSFFINIWTGMAFSVSVLGYSAKRLRHKKSKIAGAQQSGRPDENHSDEDLLSDAA